MIDVGKLKLLAKLGEGGMSTVWKALDETSNRLVAVKVLDRHFNASNADVQAFQDEERFLEEIKHPGIVQAYGFDNDGENWFFIMEYVDGYTFADLLKRKQHVRESDCLLICESVAVALDYAWNMHGIVHCDIKPENIMINTEGVIKLMDLGISHRFQHLDASEVKVSEHVLGTPAYIAPEQVYGDVELDCRADIYSLAATLYHLATGRLLFPGLSNENSMRAQCDETTQAKDPRAYHPELSEGFCQLLEAMLVKNRDYRVQNWSDVYAMCQDIERGVRFKPRDAHDACASSIRLS